MIGFFIAIISGALMSVQGVFNAEVTKQSSVWAASAFVQITAFITCILLFFVTGEGNLLGPLQVRPKYMLLGGVIGAIITYTVIQSMSMMGPAKAVMLIVVAQLVVAYLIELLGVFGVEKQPFEMKKLLGVVLMIAGIVIFKWK